MSTFEQHKAWALILAAGSGSRLASAAGLPKQFILWNGLPLYWHSAKAMSASGCIEGIVFVFPPEFCEREKARIMAISQRDDLGILWKIAAGGVTRRDSARLGLAEVPLSCEKILIHDAARPFVKPGLARRAWLGLSGEISCVVPALPVTDTIKMTCADNADIVESTLPRSRLYAAQTPQAFDAASLRLAHELALNRDIQCTDDASLMELLGFSTRLCQGDACNIKITNPSDLDLLFQQKQFTQLIGFGYDAHRYGPGRPLKLGGAPIPGGFEVIAHSDGDVLLHALMDAICGCAGLGDIGKLFPDSDPSLAGISSALLLDQILALCADAGLEIINADMTIVAQKPKISPMRDEIRRNVARLLNLPLRRVNLKATTEEGMGFTGALEGIKAYAVVSGQIPQ